ncbi:MAG: TIGR00730 family Rossman fold protein [Planctomycetaceae bacterium]|nr:TIGR00730 family Rossman fold protein [Planctomycetaceae bacterium]
MSRNKPPDPPPQLAESNVLPSEQTETAPQDFTASARAELVNELKETADKLARDEATVGDLKILSRALRELRYAFKVFAPYRKQRKVTVFGSARTPPSHPAFQGSLEFGKAMAGHGWMVVTGAGNGIMEGAHVGAGQEMSMGVNIMLPFEQMPNPVISADAKLVHLKYFFTRKLLLVKEVHGVAAFPGGFGTMDELFEILTLVQTGKRDLMPIVCVDEPGGTYWSHWDRFIREQFLDRGLISPEDTSLYRVTDNVEEAVQEVLDFYRVYNSMRYVRGKLILRLHVEPSDAFVERLNDEFSGMLESGRIEKSPAHRFESDDAHLIELPRLSMQFDRKNVGRLRQMVDLINREVGTT